MRVVCALAVLIAAATACGSAAGGSSGPGSSVGSNEVAGVYLRHASQSDRGTPGAHVKIGVYTRPISTAGPVMADPPSPIATVTTDASGRFSISVPGRARVFLAPIHDRAYAVGRWARVGGPPVTLTGCTNCVRPLASSAQSG